MKNYQILILSFLIVYVHNTCLTDKDINAPSDCHSRELSPQEEKEKNKYCCYCHSVREGEESKECLSITGDEYNNIAKTIERIELFFGTTVKSLDCQSTILQIGFLSLLFLFL